MTVGVESASGTPLHRHPLSLTRGSRAKDSLFWWGVNATIKAELVFPDPRIRKDDIPPLVMPDSDRASRAKSPYFSGASRGRESGISAAWILAFARMTAGGALRAVDSFYGRGCLSSLKSGIVFPGSSLSQG